MGSEYNSGLMKFVKKAHDLDVALLIDGEESWMQRAADDLVEEMMV